MDAKTQGSAKFRRAESPNILFLQITFEKQTKKIHPGVKRFKDQHVEG